MKTINVNEVTINGDEITAKDKNLLKGVRAGVSIKIHGDDGDVEYKVVSKHGNKITISTDDSAMTEGGTGSETRVHKDSADGTDDRRSESNDDSVHRTSVVGSDGNDSNDTALDKIKSFMHDVGFYMRKIYDPFLYAYQRLRRGYSDKDLWNAGTYQLELMSNILKEFAWNHAGEPADYENPSNWLYERDEKWFDDKDKKPLDDKVTREFNLGYYAWNEDLIKAATVIDAYANYTVKFGEDFEIYGIKEAERRSNDMNREFRKVWVWLGEHIKYLWY